MIAWELKTVAIVMSTSWRLFCQVRSSVVTAFPFNSRLKPAVIICSIPPQNPRSTSSSRSDRIQADFLMIIMKQAEGSPLCSIMMCHRCGMVLSKMRPRSRGTPPTHTYLWHLCVNQVVFLYLIKNSSSFCTKCILHNWQHWFTWSTIEDKISAVLRLKQNSLWIMKDIIR